MLGSQWHQIKFDSVVNVKMRLHCVKLVPENNGKCLTRIFLQTLVSKFATSVDQAQAIKKMLRND